MKFVKLNESLKLITFNSFEYEWKAHNFKGNFKR